MMEINNFHCFHKVNVTSDQEKYCSSCQLSHYWALVTNVGNGGAVAEGGAVVEWLEQLGYGAESRHIA